MAPCIFTCLCDDMFCAVHVTGRSCDYFPTELAFSSDLSREGGRKESERPGMLLSPQSHKQTISHLSTINRIDTSAPRACPYQRHAPHAGTCRLVRCFMSKLAVKEWKRESPCFQTSFSRLHLATTHPHSRPSPLPASPGRLACEPLLPQPPFSPARQEGGPLLLLLPPPH